MRRYRVPQQEERMRRYRSHNRKRQQLNKRGDSSVNEKI